MRKPRTVAQPKTVPKPKDSSSKGSGITRKSSGESSRTQNVSSNVAKAMRSNAGNARTLDDNDHEVFDLEDISSGSEDDEESAAAPSKMSRYLLFSSGLTYLETYGSMFLSVNVSDLREQTDMKTVKKMITDEETVAASSGILAKTEQPKKRKKKMPTPSEGVQVAIVVSDANYVYAAFMKVTAFVDASSR